MKGYKSEKRQGDVGLVESALEDIQGIIDEIGSWKDSLESNSMEHLQKYQEVSECYDALEDMDLEVSIPECADELTFEYAVLSTKRKRQNMARWARFANALDILSGAALAMQDWLDEEENQDHEDRGEVQSCRDELEALADASVDFPAMR